MPLVTRLSFFGRNEFEHPDLVDDWSAVQLNAIRRVFGAALTLTGDGREPGPKPEGGSDTSLHYVGQAFDLRTRTLTREQLFMLVWAVMVVAHAIRTTAPLLAGVELELVKGPKEQHAHVAFFKDGRPDRLELALE